MNFISIFRSPEQALELIDVQASSTPLSVLSTEKYKGICNALPLKHSDQIDEILFMLNYE